MTTPVGTYDSGPYGLGPYGGSLPGEPNWILDEMAALQNYLKGIFVSDGNNANREVDVLYSQPDPQIDTQAFPYITLDLIHVAENTPQVQTGYGAVPTYYGDLQGAPAGQGYSTTQPYLTPMLLTFQISSWARMPRHDVGIITTLFHRQLHPRFGEISIATNGSSTEGTQRRLIIQNFAKRDTTEAGKRLYRNIWTVQMTSEIFFQPLALTQQVQTVIINPVGSARNPSPSVIQPVSYP